MPVFDTFSILGLVLVCIALVGRLASPVKPRPIWPQLVGGAGMVSLIAALFIWFFALRT